MKTFFKYTSLLILLITGLSCSKDENAPTLPESVIAVPTDYANSQGVYKTNQQKIYVHYMPWFDDKTTSGNGQWGYHWKMNNRNPDNILANGRRDIASWYYPMIGPYASSDKDVIDYHFLLMKYSGIDGIIVDWYGQHHVYDYPNIKANTDAVFNRLPQTNGLEFSICYEDATLNNVFQITGLDKVTAAQQDFSWLQSHYFTAANYTKIDGKPLLLNFGPQGLLTPANWEVAFSVLNPKPFFLTLQDHQQFAGENASGTFAWVQSSNMAYLQNFYSLSSPDRSFGAAYPGFKDFYAQGNAGSTLFTIDHANTLQATLNLAKSKLANYIQVATWNDYGEGTMIEPTLDYNFESLETIQQFTGVVYTVAELQLVYKWYSLKKSHTGEPAIQERLNQAFTLLSELKVNEAHLILDPMN